MRKTLLCICGLLAAATCTAQTAAVLTSSGLAKLQVFAGTWQAQGDPDGSGKTPPSAVTTCQWSANGQYLVCDQLVKMDGNAINNLSIYSYDAQKNAYTLSIVGVPGRAPFAIPITAVGDTLFYNSEWTSDGVTHYGRTLNIFSSATAYTYMVQNSDDKITWQTQAQGWSKKISAAAP
jgi:hypothetical protein